MQSTLFAVAHHLLNCNTACFELSHMPTDLVPFPKHPTLVIFHKPHSLIASLRVKQQHLNRADFASLSVTHTATTRKTFWAHLYRLGKQAHLMTPLAAQLQVSLPW